MAAAKGGWPVCDLVLRLTGAAYGGSLETSTTVCGNEGKRVVCNLRKAGCSLIDDCCDGDRHEIKRDSRGLSGRHSTPRLWDKCSEGASRTFYTKYKEYKKRVAHANAGGAIQLSLIHI